MFKVGKIILILCLSVWVMTQICLPPLCVYIICLMVYHSGQGNSEKSRQNLWPSLSSHESDPGGTRPFFILSRDLITPLFSQGPDISVQTNIRIFSNKYWYSYSIRGNFESWILFKYSNILSEYFRILVFKIQRKCWT